MQRGEGGVKRYEVQREEVIRGCAERRGRVKIYEVHREEVMRGGAERRGKGEEI